MHAKLQAIIKALMKNPSNSNTVVKDRLSQFFRLIERFTPPPPPPPPAVPKIPRIPRI